MSRCRLLRSLAAAGAVVVTGRPAFARDVRAIPLVDQNDRAFTLASLGQATTVLTFIATRCTDTCPISQAVFVDLVRDMQRRGLDAGCVMITLDPEFDTSFVLSRRAHMLDARTPQFRFARAAPDDTRELERAFGVRVRAVDGVPDQHSAFVYVLDRDGRIKRTLPLARRPSLYLAALDLGGSVR